MISRYVYKNKKTGQRVITKEKLTDEHYELVGTWRNGKIDTKKVKIK